MQASISSSASAIGQLVHKLMTTRRLTRTDQQQLMSALLAKSQLTSEEQALVDEVYRSLEAGLLRVVD